MKVKKRLITLISMKNPYYLLLTELIKQERLSIKGFGEKYNIPSFSAIMTKLKNFPDKKLHPETIGKIEAALNIKIDDSNLENIIYSSASRINETGNLYSGALPVQKFPVLATVYAGEPSLLNHENSGEYASFYYSRQSSSCFALRVNGESMETTLRDGDIVLVDMQAEVKDGDLVAVKLKNGMQYIKRYKNLNFAFIQLISDNDKYGDRVVDKNDVIALHKVVSGYVSF